LLTSRLLRQKALNLIKVPNRRIRPQLERLWRLALGHPAPPGGWADGNQSLLVPSGCHLGYSTDSLCH